MIFIDTFYQNTLFIARFLKEGGFSKNTIKRHHNCYSLLQSWLSATNTPFSRQSASQWLNEFQKGHSSKYFKAVELYTERLLDVYETGKLRKEHLPVLAPKRKPLPKTFQRILDRYVADCTDRFSSKYLPSVKSRCTRFLHFIRNQGIQEISGITYRVLAEFRKNDVYPKETDTSIYQAVARDFLAWLADKKICGYGLSKYLYFAHQGKLILMDELPSKQKEILERRRAESMDFPSAEIPELIRDFLFILRGYQYSEITLKPYENTLWQLFLFLDMNGLGYHPDIADAWIETRKKPYDSSPDKSRRAVLLFRQFIENNGIYPQAVFQNPGALTGCIPDWCAQPVKEFLETKEKEGLTQRTVTTYRCACARFCIFLDKEGIRKFPDVTADHVKKFNLMDRHQTARSKNLYNGKIRKFLLYLADNRLLMNPGLFLSLSRKSASYDRVVVTLTNDELKSISEYTSAVDGTIGLRDRAVLELGLHMGLRASDIVNMKMENIDWKESCIRFIQKKTSRQIALPMPVSVGNALYLYITEARPESDSPYIFLKNKAPYTQLAKQACARALERALPDRDVPGSAFHVTRKTYSTALLRGGCCPDDIVDLMGHSDRQSLVRYLSLDEEGMRRCPLSLEETGILLEGGVFYV